VALPEVNRASTFRVQGAATVPRNHTRPRRAYCVSEPRSPLARVRLRLLVDPVLDDGAVDD
jgi:hypothetical protein